MAIIGAGIVGSALALWLNNQGARVSVYERRSAQAFMKRPTIQKRNINLALSHRGLKSLKPHWTAGQNHALVLPHVWKKSLSFD